MAVAVPRYLLGDDEVPDRLLSGARRPILSAGDVASHLARRRQEVPARLLCRAMRPIPMAVAVPRHLLGDNEVPVRLLRGGAAAQTFDCRRHLASRPATPRSPVRLLRGVRRPTPMAVAVARYLLGNDEVPARLLRGACRRIFSAVTVAWHLARRHQEVPRGFCVGRGGQHL